MRYHFCSIFHKSLLLSIFSLICLSFQSIAQTYNISGRVLTDKDEPVEAAIILLPQSDQWAMTDAKGDFTVQNVAKGKIQLNVSCLGYVTANYEIDMQRDTTGVKFYLERNSLLLDDVEITAKVNENSTTTSRTIDRTAMDHMQMVDVSNLMR